MLNAARCYVVNMVKSCVIHVAVFYKCKVQPWNGSKVSEYSVVGIGRDKAILKDFLSNDASQWIWNLFICIKQPAIP